MRHELFSCDFISLLFRLKRQHDDDSEAMDSGSADASAANNDMEMDIQDERHSGEGSKKARREATGDNCVNNSNGGSAPAARPSNLSLNLPIPSAKNAKACLVKVYERNVDIKLNEVYEFVGIVSLDPSLASFPATPIGNAAMDMANAFNLENEAENAAK